MLKKIIFLVLAVLTVSFIGCGPKKDGPKTLQLVWFADGNETEVIKAIIKDFEKIHPKIKIEILPVSYDQSKIKIKTMISGREAPALIRTADPADFRNFSIDLSEVIKPGDYLASIEDYYLEDGKAIAMPSSLTANGLIINTDIFKKAGVSYPTSSDNIWTWDEFVTKMKKLKSFTKYPGVFDKSSFRWATMLYEYGGSVWNQDRSEVEINKEPGVKALTKFVELQNEKIIDPSVWAGSGDPNTLFRTGRFGFHVAGSWMISNYKKLPFNWTVTYMPKGTRRSSIPGGKFIMPIKGSGAEKEAVEFIKFLAQKKNHDKYCIETMSLSPRKDSGQLDYEYGKEAFEVFANELANTPAIASNDWSNPLMTKVYPKLVDTIESALRGTAPKKALDKLATAIKETMEKGK